MKKHVLVLAPSAFVLAFGGIGARSAFPWFRSYQAASVKLVRPSVDDGMAIDVVDAGHDALLEFVL